MIEKPGLYYGMPTAEYFADPCPAPSLTQSIAKIILDRSPLHAWHRHPRLNPDHQEDHDHKFDIGTIAHGLIIGRGKDIEVLDAPDWSATGMGKGAKTKLHARRDEARACGKVPVLKKSYSKAAAMVLAAREQLQRRGLKHLFHPDMGSGEVVLAWQEGRFWFRQMIDWLSTTTATFCDYKTTDFSVAPHTLGRLMVNAGWPIQAAMADRGLRKISDKINDKINDKISDKISGKISDKIAADKKRQFIFVVQETEPPYQLSVVELSQDVMVMGHKMLDHAAATWVACMTANQFPGYPIEIVRPEFPGWAETQWLEREVHEASRERRAPFDPNILMAG